MKVALSDGKVINAFVEFKDVKVQKKGQEVVRKKTSLTISYLNGPLAGTSVMVETHCSEKDQFSKHQGRRSALLKLLAADNKMARDTAIETFRRRKPKADEGESLDVAAKKFYNFTRADRRILFGAICPLFFRNTPERKLVRERAMFDRLKKKFEGEEAKEFSVTQNIDTVKAGSTVIGLSIGKVG